MRLILIFLLSFNAFAKGNEVYYHTTPSASGGGIYIGAPLNNINELLNTNPNYEKKYLDQVQGHLNNLSSQSIILNKKVENINFYSNNQPINVAKIEKKIPEIKKEIVVLDNIPDPINVPYHIKSGDIELNKLYKNLFKVEPKFGKQKKAKEYGLIAVEEADKSYVFDDKEQGDFYKNLAIGFLDIAVGIDPISGVGRSAYELFIGRNLVTGVTLNNYERSFAFLGVVTAGQSKNISKAATGLLTIANKVSHLAPELNTIKHVINEGQQLAHSVSDIITKGWRKSHKIVSIHTAEDINNSFKLKNPHMLDPFQHNTKVIEFITTKETKFVRVFGENNVKGGWMMKYDSIKGLDANQIRNKFYLPETPLHVVDVYVPSNYSIYRGHIGEIMQYVKDGSEGAIQYYSKEFLPESSFKNIRKLEGIFQ